MQDYYTNLDLPITATPEQIDMRYRQLVRMFAPELYDDPEELAYVEKKLASVHQAYRALSSHSKGSDRSRITDRSTPQILSPAGVTKSTAELVNVARSVWQIPLHIQRVVGKRAALWLHKSALSILTICVAALIGSAAFDQSLGVLAYVQNSQQRVVRANSVAQATEQSIAYAVYSFDANANLREWTPIFSADQQQVALTVPTGDKLQVFFYDFVAKRGRKLNDSADFYLQPRWSPGGDKIAFLKNDSYEQTIQIFIPAADRSYSFSTPNDLVQITHFAWSADGNLILFEGHSRHNATEIKRWQIDLTSRHVQRDSYLETSTITWSTPLN